MYVPNLMIEVTRKCNLKCKHCLRGTAQCVSLQRKALPNIFKDIEIGALEFTGGEPLLGLYQIREIVRYIKWFDIYIGYAWLKTNGTIFSEAAIKYMNELYEIADDQCLCALEFSLDQYHTNNKNNIMYQYRELEDKYPFIKATENLNNKYNRIYTVIKEGRAKRLRQYEVTKFEKPSFNNGWYDESHDYFSDNMIYIAANGNVISDCNLSFASVDKYAFGNIYEEPLIDIIKRYTKEEEKIKKIYVK